MGFAYIKKQWNYKWQKWEKRAYELRVINSIKKSLYIIRG